MAHVRVACFSLSLDGYGAGPHQDLDHPLGIGGEAMHKWAFATRTFQREVMGEDKGETGVDDDYMKRSFENVGAWILGRNMFAPIRGPWPDDQWRGWWGDTPPYHTPVFILTHHPRESIEMAGGTTFHFVTDGIHSALEQAKAAANGKDVRIGGGPDTIRQYLKAGLIDELHLVITPTLLGRGESMLEGLDLPALGYHCERFAPSKAVTHVLLTRTG